MLKIPDMNDEKDAQSINTSSNSSGSPFSVSRRAFLGMVAGAGAVCVGESASAPGRSPAGPVGESNPVNLLPRLTPRPEGVAGVARPWVDLTGTWRFNPSPGAEFWKDSSDAGWSDIQVPGEWTMQGFSVKARQPGCYRLRFAAPADWAGHRIKVRFDAVYSKAEVWMNGSPVGSHLGAFTPFEVDVSEAVMPGKDNVLTLAVTSESLSEELVSGYIMVGHQMGGIIRKASIFAVPETHISSLHVNTTFDGDFKNAVLHVLADIANEGRTDVNNAEIQFRLRELGPDGKWVNLNPATFKLPAIKACQVLSHVIQLPVESPKKWDAEHPNLYALNCELKVGGKQYSTQRRFGFRQVDIKDGQFLLNGQPIRLRGVVRQDSHPLMGRTVPPEVQRQDIEWMLWANSNNTYTCAFLPDEEVLNLCDEAGLYAMDEPGTCWVGLLGEDMPTLWKTESFDDPKYFPYYLQPVLEMIERDRSHPSVITWMLADESVCGKNFREVLKMVRAVDSSRPVHIAWDPESGAELAGFELVPSPFDVASWHYPGVKEFAHAASSKRPVLFDQSVHVYCGDVSEVMTDPGLRDDWGRQYAPFWEKVWETRSILGAQVFNFTDDVFLLPSGQVLGYGDWGLIDYWRRAKPDLWHVKKAHTPIKIPDGPIPLPAAGRLEVPVENRYDFTDLRDVRIEWSVGHESGTVQAHLPPHGKGTITIPARGTDLNGKTLSLKFFRKDLMVDAYKLPIGKAAEPASMAPSVANWKIELVETKDTIAARGNNVEWVISRKTGEIIKATRKGRTVLVGGPVLMLLPTKEEKYTSGYPMPRPVASPFNATCGDWKAASVSATHSPGVIEISVDGQYREAAGSYALRISGDGSATVSYHFTYAGPEKIDPRQIGVVFYVARSCDTLAWKRKAQWSVYPEDHIGRAEGVAHALRDPSQPEVAYREKPTWPWSMDANTLGTRDFRATRRNILHASLKDPSGTGVTVWSDGTHHTRSFLDGNRIGLLVASHSGPGNFWGIRGLCEVAQAENTPLEKGAEIKDTVRLSLVGA